LKKLNNLRKKVSNYKIERSNINNNTFKKKENKRKKLLQ